MTFTIHCTKKLLDRVILPVSTEHITPTTYLGNWYATALFWKPQVALLINERTLLPVLMPLAPAVELALRFPEHLASVLANPAMDMDEVAYLLGYEDQSSFFRAFRLWEGETPSSWRFAQQNHRTLQ